MRTMLSGQRARLMNPAPAVAGAADFRSYFGGKAARNFIAPAPGLYRFLLWGGGGRYSVVDFRSEGGKQYEPSGGSGSLAVIDRRMQKGEAVALLAGGPGFATTATFADGWVVTAGAGGVPNYNYSTSQFIPGAGGIATGGDVNLPGLRGGIPGATALSGGVDGGAAGADRFDTWWEEYGGSGAPGFDGFEGGDGGTVTELRGTSPGGGGTRLSPPGGGHIFVIRRQ